MRLASFTAAFSLTLLAAAACSSSDSSNGGGGGGGGDAASKSDATSADGAASSGGDGGASASDGGDTTNDGATGTDGGAGGSDSGGADAGAFALTSTLLMSGGTWPSAYTCAGAMQNTSPPLAWTGAPAGAKSFAVVMVDAFFMPPKVHWIIYDLGPAVASLPSGIPAGYVVANPSAHQSLGDFAGNQYLGPCPPQGGGAHEYDITLHALDVDTLPGLGMSSTAATTQAAVLAHSIATSKMTLTFSR